MTRLAGDADKLARYFQIREGELSTKAVTDPRAAVTVDVSKTSGMYRWIVIRFGTGRPMVDRRCGDSRFPRLAPRLSTGKAIEWMLDTKFSAQGF
jgi:hypothetical protein